MPTPKLSISLRNANKKIARLEHFRNESRNLEARYQHFVGEMIMIRLFATFEDLVAEMAYKIAAGATYLNGSKPTVHHYANNVSGSRGLFLSFGRNKPIQNLKWTKSKYIRESIQHVIPASEKFILNAQIHGSLIDEMRKIRNVLAHNSPGAKADFRAVVHQIYGANINISTGAFLCSEIRSPVSNLSRYFSSTSVILSDMASGA